MSVPPHPLQPALYAHFADSIRHFYSRKSAKLVDKIGIPSIKKTHWTLLHYLADHNGMIQQDIADSVSVSRSTISELISDMEQADLLYRAVCPGNRRKVQVFLTERGLKMAEQIQSLYIEYLSECLQDFSQEEVAVLESLMKKLR